MQFDMTLTVMIRSLKFQTSRSDCVNAQADQNRRSANMPENAFSHFAAHLKCDISE